MDNTFGHRHTNACTHVCTHTHTYTHTHTHTRVSKRTHVYTRRRTLFNHIIFRGSFSIDWFLRQGGQFQGNEFSLGPDSCPLELLCWNRSDRISICLRTNLKGKWNIFDEPWRGGVVVCFTWQTSISGLSFFPGRIYIQIKFLHLWSTYLLFLRPIHTLCVDWPPKKQISTSQM